jgi:hypothetical protein
VSDIGLLTADLISGLEFGADEWGLFDDGGGLAIDADSFVALDLRVEASLSNHPIEDGGFANYNKVDRPFQGRLSYAQGGSVSDREAVLAQVQAAQDSLNLYTLVMPEDSFENVNVVAFDFSRRAQSGVGLLLIDVMVEEVRLTAPTQYEPAQENSAASDANNGTVSASAAEAPQRGSALVDSNTTVSASAAETPLRAAVVPSPSSPAVSTPEPAIVSAPSPAVVSNPTTGLLISQPDNYTAPAVVTEPQISFSQPSATPIDLVANPTGGYLLSSAPIDGRIPAPPAPTTTNPAFTENGRTIPMPSLSTLQ